MANTVEPASQNHVMFGSAKVWIKFRGSSTVLIRDSFNVTSITDNGTGKYTVTINSNMSNGNYASAYKAGNTYDGANSIREIESPTSNTGSLQVYSGTPTSNNDAPNYHIHVQGDFS